MAVGKVSGTILKRSVVNLLKCPPRTGIDTAVFPFGSGRILSSCETGLADCVIAPDLAVYKAANNIWVSGGRLLGVEAAFILPKSYNEYNLKAYTKRVKAACERCGTYLAGGHTEVTDAVKRFCISITAIGITEKEVPDIHRVKPGMDLVVTKWIGLEEMAIIHSSEEKMELLYSRFSREYLEVLGLYEDWLRVEEEAAAAIDFGANAVHDISDGGIFAALWDLAEGSGCGLCVDLKSIPIRQETVEAAEYFHLNPYMMKSSGSILIACDDGKALTAYMENKGIPAVCIGVTTDNNDKILRNGDEIRCLDKS